MIEIRNDNNQVGISMSEWCNRFQGSRFNRETATIEGWMNLENNQGGQLHYDLPCKPNIWALKLISESCCCRTFWVFLFVRLEDASDKVANVSFTLVEIFLDGETEVQDFWFGLDPVDETMCKAELSTVTTEPEGGE